MGERDVVEWRYQFDLVEELDSNPVPHVVKPFSEGVHQQALADTYQKLFKVGKYKEAPSDKDKLLLYRSGEKYKATLEKRKIVNDLKALDNVLGRKL